MGRGSSEILLPKMSASRHGYSRAIQASASGAEVLLHLSRLSWDGDTEMTALLIIVTGVAVLFLWMALSL